jgi:hypothetical protein
MSFFEPPARPTAEVARAKVVGPPAWIAPPHNVLPGITPVQLIVVRTDETIAAVAGIQAYPAGFCLPLSLRLRNPSVREEQRLPYLFDSTDPEDDPLAGDFLRFGVQFADGRKATTLDHPPVRPRGPSARPASAEGTRRGRWRHRLGHGELAVAAATSRAVRLRM